MKVQSYRFELLLARSDEARFKYDEVKTKYGLKMDIRQAAEYLNVSQRTAWRWVAVEVNREWGFEASRIKIIGKAYYNATDWQYIRFNCAHMTWLWMNSNLYQVYES